MKPLPEAITILYPFRPDVSVGKARSVMDGSQARIIKELFEASTTVGFVGTKLPFFGLRVARRMNGAAKSARRDAYLQLDPGL
ncbi:MAG: hypothetical protein UX30_C0007G0019 [Candidatus Saccharibacteria bacterium GW2011_GWA2_46_10]|nr:MAG: hypothetical protein UX30_C0007G0019 [Candidatus Saccharibacteria bacterium GW2011_GWA2_46_10]OGL36171.1 MAG: hypothetical protein A3F05_02620 [Candidatus Saccharibacteria bacterium RIFCSPHIGHO2_12_FULL_47_17]